MRLPNVIFLLLVHSVVCPLGVSFDGEGAGLDGPEHKGLSEWSQAVGVILSLLLVLLTDCLLALLLHKKERSEAVISKLTNCCGRSSNKEEEIDENETEWLMEEIQLPTPRLGRRPENRHITTKPVKAHALTSLHGDDQDSEDEVPDHPRGESSCGQRSLGGSSQSMRNPQWKGVREREDGRVGLVQGEKARKGSSRPEQHNLSTSTHLVSFHDDGDEDLLHI